MPRALTSPLRPYTPRATSAAEQVRRWRDGARG